MTMNKAKLLSTYLLAGLILSVSNPYGYASAQIPSAPLPLSEYSSIIGFNPPPDNGSPNRTRSGATRDGSCEGYAFTLDDSVGLTTEEQLVLHLYLPTPEDEGSAVDRVALSMKTPDGSEIYETRVDLADSEGIVKVNLPEALPALELEKEYVWSAVLMCNGQLSPGSPVLTGAIRRVAPMMTAEQMATTSLSHRSALYGESGLWYDWITSLAMLRIEDPSDSRLFEMGQHLQSIADSQKQG